ncbi:MAG: amino acid ABC transporter substrate-binding protein [Verrucomicrobia bacterium]|nr:amino acid ABC transporter substrate-binding protein [Verrucomicrobiota bacterium]
MKALFLICALGAAFCASCASSKEARPQNGYRVAQDPSWRPLELLGRETEVSAFSEELLRQIGTEQGFLISMYTADQSAFFDLLRQGRVQGVLSPMPPLPFYQDWLAFSEVYLYVGPVLVVPIDSSATKIEDMRGRVVGVESGTSSMLVVARLPDVSIRDFLILSEALGALLRGQIDGVVMPALPAYSYVSNLYRDELKVATAPLTDEGLRLIALKGDPDELIRHFNAGLAALKKRGDYLALEQKWNVVVPVPKGE